MHVVESNKQREMQNSQSKTYQKEVLNCLSDLMQLDIDAVEAYEQALKNIDTQLVHDKIDSFRMDHVRHIDELGAMIKRLGGDPPARTKDIKGFFIKGMTAIRSMMGEEAALNAMRSNEELTNKTYKEALEHLIEYSAENARQLVQKNYQDEQRHLAYINALLRK